MPALTVSYTPEPVCHLSGRAAAPPTDTISPEIRFERHKYGVKDNSYVRRYGVRLRPDLYAGLNPLPYAQAQRMEWVLARELRSDGWAVWQK